MEPANLKAKLLLANALLVSITRPGPDNPLAARARQQYLDVLALDSGNKQALHGLMTAGHQHQTVRRGARVGAEGHPGRPHGQGAYYTVGFIDWA